MKNSATPELELVLEIVESLAEGDLSDYQVFMIACKIRENQIAKEYNELYAKAHVLNDSTPSALESIAIELGAARDGDSIKRAIQSLRKSE